MPTSSSMRAGGRHHRLHEEPVEPRLRACVADAREHRRGGLAHRAGIAELERDAADIGFVDDVGRADLQRDRKPERRGCDGGLVGIGGDARAGGECRRRRARPRLLPGRARTVPSASAAAIAVRAAPGSAVVGLGPRRRRLHQQRLIALIAHAVQKRADRVLGRFVGRRCGPR